MMKLFYLVIGMILIFVPWFADAQMNTNSLPPACTFAARATCVPQVQGTQVLITDCSDADCTAGGGSTAQIHEYDGSAWVGGSSDITIGSTDAAGDGTIATVGTQNVLIDSVNGLVFTQDGTKLFMEDGSYGRLHFQTSIDTTPQFVFSRTNGGVETAAFAAIYTFGTGRWLKIGTTGNDVIIASDIIRIPNGADAPSTGGACTTGDFFIDTDTIGGTNCSTTKVPAICICQGGAWNEY